MTGLEQRLRGVAGVSDIVVELSDSGLEGIRVRMHDGTDETEILDEIRRILVAYGLKGSARSLRAKSVESLDLRDDLREEIRTDEPHGPAALANTRMAPAGDTPPFVSHFDRDMAEALLDTLPTPEIFSDSTGMTIRLGDGFRTVEAHADSSPLGAADAMVRAMCDWKGARYPSRIALDRIDIDGLDVVLLVARRNGEATIGSSAINGNLAEALRDAASQIVDRLSA